MQIIGNIVYIYITNKKVTNLENLLSIISNILNTILWWQIITFSIINIVSFISKLKQ